jgi:polysaccharide export outer membrane protein
MRSISLSCLCLALSAIPAAGGPQEEPAEVRSTYVLGPEDQISIWALDAEEINNKPVVIGATGHINLPLVGRVRAAGLTVEQLEAEITAKLKTYIEDPKVSVTVAEFRSQPVSVIGAVNSPGVHQLRGRKTLVEILSMAGGIRNDAGNTVKITRRLEWGRVPLATAKEDATGQFSVAEVNLRDVMEASKPEENILIRPQDVISVPRAEMIYVIGEVPRSGGFVLNERETLSVLQALSLAGGLGRTAAPHNARILRASAGSPKRAEIPVDLKKILAGKKPDVPLEPEDILFVPSSTGKTVALRSLEAALSVGTGVAVWRGSR